MTGDGIGNKIVTKVGGSGDAKIRVGDQTAEGESNVIKHDITGTGQTNI